jgi:hypothetical protein
MARAAIGPGESPPHHNFRIEWAGLFYGPPGQEHENGIRNHWRRDRRDSYSGIRSAEETGCRARADGRAAESSCAVSRRFRPNERFLLIALVAVIALAVLHLIWKALPK